MSIDISVLREAIAYPWNDGESGTTLVGGGILTLLSPLIVPAVFVLGYNLRVVESVLDGQEDPPEFRDWGDLFVDGIKAVVVLVAYVLLPLAVGTFILAFVASAAGFNFGGPFPTIPAALSVGGVFLVVALLLAGLALVVAYIAPAALVQLARTRSLGAAFSTDDVQALAKANAYGSTWLLAVLVFAANSLVLFVLNAAGVGVILSGFLSFYVFVAMAYLFAIAAAEIGYDIDRQEESAVAEEEPAESEDG